MDVGRRARHVVAGALVLEFGCGGQLGLDQVGQLQVFEEVVHEFFARQLEDEIVLGHLVAIAGLAAAGAAAALGTVDQVALEVFLVAGVDGFPHAAVSVAERGLAHVLDRDGNFFAILNVGDGAAFDGTSHRVLDLGLVAPQEALAVDRRLVLALQTSVDEVSQKMPPAAIGRRRAATALCGAARNTSKTTSSHANTIRTAAAPAWPYSLSRPCGRRSRRACWRLRRWPWR